MAHQKNATPTKAQQEVMRANGLAPRDWTVVRDFNYSMIVRNRTSEEYRVIEKHTNF